jgi:hypothetical protein
VRDEGFCTIYRGVQLGTRVSNCRMQLTGSNKTPSWLAVEEISLSNRAGSGLQLILDTLGRANLITHE